MFSLGFFRLLPFKNTNNRVSSVFRKKSVLDETIGAGPGNIGAVPRRSSLGPPMFGKGSLGASWVNLDLSEIPLGSLWGHIGGHLGSCLANPGPSWDHFWAIWGTSWGIFYDFGQSPEKAQNGKK